MHEVKTKSHAGKGSKRRPQFIPMTKYDENYMLTYGSGTVRMPKLTRLVYYPHAALSQIAQPLTEANLKYDLRLYFNIIAKKMLKICEKNNGAGLAGNQVNFLYRMIVLNTETFPQFIMYNPELVTPQSPADMNYDLESCLSIPEVTVNVFRQSRIVVKGYNEFGEEMLVAAKGFDARVFQHEIDHLNGVTILDYQ